MLTTKKEVMEWVWLLEAHDDMLFIGKWCNECPIAPKVVSDAALRFVEGCRVHNPKTPALRNTLVTRLHLWAEQLEDPAPEVLGVLQLYIEGVCAIAAKFITGERTSKDTAEALHLVGGVPRSVFEALQAYADIYVEKPTHTLEVFNLRCYETDRFIDVVSEWTNGLLQQVNDVRLSVVDAQRWERRVKVLERRLDDIRAVAAGGRSHD
jgi:hypothetical protein